MFCQDKGLEITYKTVSKYDIEQLKKDPSIDNFKLEYIKNIKEDYESLTYTLKASKKESIFETVIEMDIDSRKSPIKELIRNQRFYVNEEHLIEQKNFLGEKLLIIEDAHKQNWKLLPESIEILDYECKKATLTYTEAGQKFEIVAWFAPDLNYNFGPKGFHGLPGLILKLERNNVLVFEATSIKSKEDIYIFKPNEGKKITREKINVRMEATIKKMSQ